jgi:hypothetical protein
MMNQRKEVETVLQEGPPVPQRKKWWCGDCQGEVVHRWDPLIADHIRLYWQCNMCGRIWRIGGAVMLAGTVRDLTQAESQQSWREGAAYE